MRIAVGADHAGFEMKRDLAAVLRTLGHEVVLYDGAFQDWAARGLPVEIP